MADEKAAPIQIDSTIWGYIKPILTTNVMRGLTGIAAIAASHGLNVGNPTETQAAAVVGGILWVVLQFQGSIKSWLSHRQSVKLGTAAPNSVAVVK